MKRKGSIFYKVVNKDTRKSIVLGKRRNGVAALHYPEKAEVEAKAGTLGVLVFETREDAGYFMMQHGWFEEGIIIKVKALTTPTYLAFTPQWEFDDMLDFLEGRTPYKPEQDSTEEFPRGTWGVQKILTLE